MLYSYDAAGRMTTIEWPDGFRAEYAHDLPGAVTTIDQHVPPAAATGLAAYAYDNLGQLTGVTRAGGSGASSSYGYDTFARLTSLAHNPDGSSNDLTLGFSYNPAGQIVGRTISDDDYVWTLAIGLTTYTLNGLNEVTEVDSTSVTYDDNQNATGVSGNIYGYDAANRLTSATPSGGSAASFVFDPLDRLASSTVSSTTTRYQYAGQQLATEYDASGAVTRRYIPGLGLDDVVTAYTGSGVTTPDWLLADERGSVVALTGSTGAVSTINRYDEYGVPASGNTGRFQYTGQLWMPEAAAYHYRARTYLPQVGRFGQPDPIGYSAGANLYAYVGADPVNLVDPMGLQSRLPNTRRCTRREEEEAVRSSSSTRGSGDVCVVPDEFARSQMPVGGGGSTSDYFGYMPGYDPVMNRPEFAPYQAERLQAIHDNQWMVWVALAPEAAVALAETGTILSARAIARACNNCFEAGTDVLTAVGPRDIETIKVGDLVLSRDDVSGETAFKPVVALIDGAERQIWEVTVEVVDAEGAARRETLGATDDHPWRLVGGDWAETSELYPGAELVTADGLRAVVVAVGQTDRIERTYNFEVEGFHTYFVGETGVWVHNACRPFDFPRSVKNLIRALTPNCTNCGVRTIWGVRDVRGVTPSPIRSEIHHRVPGVGRGVEDGVNLCLRCHRLEHPR